MGNQARLDSYVHIHTCSACACACACASMNHRVLCSQSALSLGNCVTCAWVALWCVCVCVCLQTPGPAGEVNVTVASSNDTVPNEMDWREHGAVGPVRDQGYCGSCWAFSAVGAIEGAEYVTNGKRMGLKSPVGLSVEQMVECQETAHACYGGWNDKAITWVQEVGGIATEEAYPYTRLTQPNWHVVCLANQVC